MDIGNFRRNMQTVGNVAGGIQNGMQGRPFQSRYGQPPPAGGPPMTQDQGMVRPGDDSQFGGGASPTPAGPAPWRTALNTAGRVAGGIQRGMQGGQPQSMMRRTPDPSQPAPAPSTQQPPPGQNPLQPGQFFGGGSIVDRPTRAIIGEDGPEAVVPLHPRAGARMRPSAVFGKRYGAA